MARGGNQGGRSSLQHLARRALLIGKYLCVGNRRKSAKNTFGCQSRASESAEQLSAADTVRGYKSLAQVERAFRSLKGLDLLIRPIRHRTEERVPAHIFLCLLAYYRGVALAARVGTSAV